MTKQWVEPDIRDRIVTYVQEMSRRSSLTQQWFIGKIGIQMSKSTMADKYHDWLKRYGSPNQHNGKIPRYWWIMDLEKEAIIDSPWRIEYCRERVSEGYRRLIYMMIDEYIAAVSPASVYRILSEGSLGESPKVCYIAGTIRNNLQRVTDLNNPKHLMNTGIWISHM